MKNPTNVPKVLKFFFPAILMNQYNCPKRASPVTKIIKIPGIVLNTNCGLIKRKWNIENINPK